MTISTIIGKPDNRAGHVDCVPTLFVFNTTSTQPVQGVVTPIVPVLTSATAVKIVKTEIKEWSRLAESALVNGQDVPKLANYQGLTRYHWSKW